MHSTRLPDGTELTQGFPRMHSLKRLNNLKLTKLLKVRAREITKLITLILEICSSQCFYTSTLLRIYQKRRLRNLMALIVLWPTPRHSLTEQTRTLYSTL